MSFGGTGGRGGGDAHFQSFINQMSQKQQLQGVIHDLNEKCWDTCVDKPGVRLEHKTQDCLKSCVNRFLDANILVTQRMEQQGQKLASAAARDSEVLGS